jgi:hypothetical protein
MFLPLGCALLCGQSVRDAEAFMQRDDGSRQSGRRADACVLRAFRDLAEGTESRHKSDWTPSANQLKK